jgi:hypothetical protein
LLDILTYIEISNILLWRIKAYIKAQGYKSSASLKTTCLHGLPLPGKEYGLKKKRRLKIIKVK